MYPVITISREFGSGGHSIGKLVAEKLDIPFYDSEIVERAAKATGLDVHFAEEQGEYSSRLDRWFTTLSHFGDPQDQLFWAQSELIRRYADEGPCVIVGRCADYILGECGHLTLNVFIHASTKYRAARVLDKYGETSVSIGKRLDKKDRSRKAYYRYYTDREWGDYHNYHVILDPSMLGEETCASMIVQAAERMNELEI